MEHKYLLTRQEALTLSGAVGNILPRDPYAAGSEGYIVRSLYFDTVADGCCAQKEDGLRYHEKIRLRCYGCGNGILKLECKQKDGIRQRKISMPIDRDLFRSLCRGAYGVLLDSSDPTGEFFYRKLSTGMKPKAIISYRRISFCHPTNNTRITFDYDIRSTESSLNLLDSKLPGTPVLPPGMVVLEVKYNHFLLGYVKNTLAGMQKSACACSKYQAGRSFCRYLI